MFFSVPSLTCPLPASLFLYLNPFLVFVLPHVFVSLSCVATLCFSPIACFYVALMITGLNVGFDLYFTLALYLCVFLFATLYLGIWHFLDIILSFSYQSLPSLILAYVCCIMVLIFYFKYFFGLIDRTTEDFDGKQDEREGE